VDMSERLPYLSRINELAAYSCAEAARYLGLPVTTVRAWIRGQPYRTNTGEHYFQRVIIPTDEESKSLSFGNLVELFVLSSLRRVHGVPLKNIRAAIHLTRGYFGTQHPLSDLDLLTDKNDVFVERFGEYLNLSQDGQLEMKSELQECLRRIEKDASGIPRKLFPLGIAAKIAIDPRVNFGRPSIVGVGVPTDVVYDRFNSGESLEFLASDYKCNEALLREAIRYEGFSRNVAA
jgi:uncharacterized protein (DUF433 family)